LPYGRTLNSVREPPHERPQYTPLSWSTTGVGRKATMLESDVIVEWKWAMATGSRSVLELAPHVDGAPNHGCHGPDPG